MEKKPFYYDPHPDRLENKDDLNKDVAESVRLALRNAIVVFVAFVVVAIITAVINYLKTQGVLVEGNQILITFIFIKKLLSTVIQGELKRDAYLEVGDTVAILGCNAPLA